MFQHGSARVDLPIEVKDTCATPKYAQIKMEVVKTIPIYPGVCCPFSDCICAAAAPDAAPSFPSSSSVSVCASRYRYSFIGAWNIFPFWYWCRAHPLTGRTATAQRNSNWTTFRWQKFHYHIWIDKTRQSIPSATHTHTHTPDNEDTTSWLWLLLLVDMWASKLSKLTLWHAILVVGGGQRTNIVSACVAFGCHLRR